MERLGQAGAEGLEGEDAVTFMPFFFVTFPRFTTKTERRIADSGSCGGTPSRPLHDNSMLGKRLLHNVVRVDYVRHTDN